MENLPDLSTLFGGSTRTPSPEDIEVQNLARERLKTLLRDTDLSSADTPLLATLYTIAKGI
jgi:hypothetical protein